MNPAVTAFLAESPQIAYAITDADLRIVEVFGDPIHFPECAPQNVGDRLLDHVPELIGYGAELALILAAQTPHLQLPVVNRTTSDEVAIYIRVTELPYRDDVGEIQGIIHLLQDVSEMGQLQQHLAQQRNDLLLLQDELRVRNYDLQVANAALHRVNDAKATFVAMASHELKTPLTCIEGFLHIILLGEEQLSAQHQKHLGTIQRNAIRLRHVVTDLLDLARAEFGQIDIFLKPMDLSALIHEATSSLMPLFTAKSQQLTLPTDSVLPPVLCDGNRVVQILTNLLSNAHKYTPAQGRIELVVQKADEADYVQIAVADSGIGIADAEQAQVFERFFRTQEAQWQQEAGVGLGLYITRLLVELHGGKIWFESIPNQGSTFYITLPTALPESPSPQV